MSTLIAMKFEEDVLEAMEADMQREHYDSRAEYFRSTVQEDVREKYLQKAHEGLKYLSELGVRESWKRPTQKEIRKIKEKVSKDYE